MFRCSGLGLCELIGSCLEKIKRVRIIKALFVGITGIIWGESDPIWFLCLCLNPEPLMILKSPSQLISLEEETDEESFSSSIFLFVQTFYYPPCNIRLLFPLAASLLTPRCLGCSDAGCTFYLLIFRFYKNLKYVWTVVQTFMFPSGWAVITVVILWPHQVNIVILSWGNTCRTKDILISLSWTEH